MTNRLAHFLTVAIAAAALSACTTSEVLVAHSVNLSAADQAAPVPEDELLDVAVRVFDPGVPEGEIDKEVLEELLDAGTFVHIRRAESMYMAVELRDALQASGYWGAAWVTPQESLAADVNVTAQILHSDGDVVRVHVTAVDATGRQWFSKPYEIETAAGSFNRQLYSGLDPYQDLYHMIANDLATGRRQLSAEQVREVRTVASLRYAADLSPEAFDGYVAQNRSGAYQVVRLPATDDPMYDRTQRVRQRERLFFDTLDQHYEKFSVDAQPSYDSWREYAREESLAIKELQRSARWRTGIGIATILASIVYGSEHGDSFSDRIVRDSMMYIGSDMLQSSAVHRREKQLHVETLEELSTSFEDEVEPLVVDVAGVQHRLVGTADVQYAEWRNLLRQLFITETGFVPENMEIYAEPEAQPEAAEVSSDEAPADAPAQDAVAPVEPAADQTSAQEFNADDSGGSASGI